MGAITSAKVPFSSVTDQLRETEQQVARMDTRLTEIKAELAALDSQRLVSAPLNETLAQFGPLWVEDPACGEALTECEWTRLVGSLISSAAYDAESGEVGVELRDTNISPV